MILTVTMNPAIDTAYHLDHLIIDDVNRVVPKKTAGDGGKIMLDAVGVHKLAHVSAHVAPPKAGRDNVVAKLAPHAGDVKAPAPGRLIVHHALPVTAVMTVCK